MRFTPFSGSIRPRQATARTSGVAGGAAAVAARRVVTEKPATAMAVTTSRVEIQSAAGVSFAIGARAASHEGVSGEHPVPGLPLLSNHHDDWLRGRGDRAGRLELLNR